MSKGKINYEVILPGSKVFFVGQRAILGMPPRDVFETKAELLASLASDE